MMSVLSLALLISVSCAQLIADTYAPHIAINRYLMTYFLLASSLARVVPRPV